MKGKEKELGKMCCEILDSLDSVAKVVSCGELVGDRLIIYDPPYELEIGGGKGGRIVLKEGDEEVAILTPLGVEFVRSEEDLKVLEDWCIALTSLSFRRFVVKRRSGRG